MSSGEFEPVRGRCECGGVSYEVTAPARELYHCHCTRCRRLHGALFATYAYVRRDEVVISAADGAIGIYRSPNASWHFCTGCGCHLFAEHEQNPGAMWYMPATLDEGLDPGHPRDSEKHIFAGSKSHLDTIGDDLPRYDAYAPPEVSITARKTR